MTDALARSVASTVATRIEAVLGVGGATLVAAVGEAQQLAQDADALRPRLGPADAPDLGQAMAAAARDGRR